MLIRVGPYLGLGALAVMVGFTVADFILVVDRMYFQIALLGLSIGLILLDKERGWNLVLFVLFGISAGTVLFHSSPHTYSWILFFFLIVVSLVGGFLIEESGGRAANVLFASTIIYLAGWILSSFIQHPDFTGEIWIILGLVLYTCIAMAVISHGKGQRGEESAIPLSIHLLIVFVNLSWLSSMV